MKKFLIAGLFILSFNASAQVYFQANCVLLNRATAQCSFCNYNISRFPIHCTMNIQGQTFFGAFANGFVNGPVAPGLCLYGTVNAFNPINDPLTRAFANVVCR